MVGLPGSEKSLTICLAVSTQYQRVTDRKMHQSIEHMTSYLSAIVSMALSYTSFEIFDF